MATLGFIGLGIMGAPMAANLQAGGHNPVILPDPNGLLAARWVRHGECPGPEERLNLFRRQR